MIQDSIKTGKTAENEPEKLQKLGKTAGNNS
jgi:hypothetical protein